jgi:hypothetical protein
VETDINQMFQTFFDDFDINKYMLDVDLTLADLVDVSEWDVDLK